MKKILALILCLILLFSLSACGGKDKETGSTPQSGIEITLGKLPENPPAKPAYVEVGENGSRTEDEVGFQLELPEIGEKIAVFETSMGTIYMRLFPESAPITVTNFVGLIESGYYNGVSFHRVIDGFMIQGGDPDGTGSGGTSVWGGKFEDEFNANLLNIRGSLSMANSGLGTNGSQFFINQNNTPVSKSNYDYNTLYKQLEDQNAEALKEQYELYKNDEQYKEYFKDYADADAYVKGAIDQYIGESMILSDTVSDEAWALYKKYGGNIHLDGAFKGGYGGHSVFAQVFKGMSVVDSIAAVETDSNDKPVNAVIVNRAYTTTVTEEILANPDGATPINEGGVIVP